MRFTIILIGGILFGYNNCVAQGDNWNFTVGIISPEPSNNIGASQIQNLESKIIQLVNSSNQATIGYNNDIIIYPIINIGSSNIVSGGIQNMTITQVELTLIIKQIGTNVIFNSISINLQGSGNNSQQALTNAISQIKPAEAIYKDFIKTSKGKVYSYYESNCSMLMQTADNLSYKQEYENAISLLESIPPGLGCSNEAQKKAIIIFKQYQNIACKKYLNEAKSSIAINDFNSAIESLTKIDPNSNCFADANKLINQISDKVTARQKQGFTLEQQRINAIKEIAKAYYSRTIKITNYNLL